MVKKKKRKKSNFQDTHTLYLHQSWNIPRPINQAIPLLGIFPMDNPCPRQTNKNLYCCIVHNSQRLETTQMSIHERWLSKLWYILSEVSQQEKGKNHIISLTEPKIQHKEPKIQHKEFPAGLVVRNPCFHCCGPGSVPGWGAKILQATQCGQQKSKIWHKGTYLRNRNRLTDTENRLVVAKEEGGWGKDGLGVWD